MHVSLNPEMQRFVEEKVSSGQYARPEDVIYHALTVLRAQDAQTPEDVDELRRMISAGIVQLERGDAAEWNAEDLKRRVRERAGQDKRAG